MDDELIRAWLADHSMLVSSVAVSVVVLSSTIQAVRWWRKTNLPEAKTELIRGLSTAAARPRAVAVSRRTARIGTAVFLALSLVALSLAVAFSWDEYGWIGAEVARARFVELTRNSAGLTAQYQVTPATRPPFRAIFSFTPRGDHWDQAGEAMKSDRVVDVHSGEPLRYREHELASSSKDPRGWALIGFNGALGGFFGGMFLLFAFGFHRAARVGG